MKFEELVKKTLTDEAFRKHVAKDPEGALRAAGIDPTPEQVEALRGVDRHSMQRLVKAFGNGKGIDCIG